MWHAHAAEALLEWGAEAHAANPASRFLTSEMQCVDCEFRSLHCVCPIQIAGTRNPNRNSEFRVLGSGFRIVAFDFWKVGIFRNVGNSLKPSGITEIF